VLVALARAEVTAAEAEEAIEEAWLAAL